MVQALHDGDVKASILIDDAAAVERSLALDVIADGRWHLYQWNLADTGFGIHVPSAWDLSTGTGVLVAVLDTGIAYETYGSFKPAPEIVKAVKDGNVGMTVELNPVLWGRLGVDVLAAYLKGERTEQRVFIKHVIIDPANVDDAISRVTRS